MKVSVVASILALILFIGSKYLGDKVIQISAIVLMVALILSQLVEVISFFSKYEHSKGQLTKLKIQETHIIWNNTVIKWSEIIDFKIGYNEIDNELNIKLGPKNNKSDGMNTISIITEHGKEYNGHYHIKSDYDLNKLKDLLWDCIVKNKINYNIAKNIVKPESYKEHQNLKNELREITDNTL